MTTGTATTIAQEQAAGGVVDEAARRLQNEAPGENGHYGPNEEGRLGGPNVFERGASIMLPEPAPIFKEINALGKGDGLPDPGQPSAPSVFDYYKPDSRSKMARLAKQKAFENITLGIISVNACWIGIDTDLNDAAEITTAQPVFVIAENFFCFYFTGEVLIRFLAFQRKRDCLRDGWFKFDSVLVFFMVLETWIIPVLMMILGGGGTGGALGNLSILRLLRLLRLTRMARLMKSVPELLTLIKGMAAATRSVSATMGLLIIFLYVFAIIFTGSMKEVFENGPESIGCPDPRSFPDGTCDDRLEEIYGNYRKMWGNMSRSMFTLFVGGTLLDDFFGVSRDLADGFPMLLWALMIFVLLSAFTVLNMLIGVLCEVVSETAAGEKMKAVDAEVGSKLAKVFSEIDVDGSGQISETEFKLMQGNEEVLEAFDSMGIDPRHLTSMSAELFEMSDEDVHNELKEKNCSIKDLDTMKELSFEEFLEVILRLRPERGASVLDFAEMKKNMRKALARIDNQMDDLLTSMENLEHGMHANVLSPERGMQQHGGTLAVPQKEQPSMGKENPPRPPGLAGAGMPAGPPLDASAGAEGKLSPREEKDAALAEDEAFMSELLHMEQRRSAGLERELARVRALINVKGGL